ncbi:MAG: carboxypeptidase regulatory-like domain-containing protein [bacterium]
MKHLIKATIKIHAAAMLTLLLGAAVQTAGGANDADYTATDVKNGGTIRGTITFSGEVPAIKEIKVNKDKKVCGKHKTDESLIVNSENRGLENVVVFLKNVKSGKKWAFDEASLEMNQKGCMFSPHVLIVPVGQKLNMLNDDGILHNIHTRSQVNPEFNRAQPKFLKKIKFGFDKPEFVKITCDVHSWMQAWIVVAANPYYAVTDADGNFELTNVPPGTYELEIWQEKLGQQSQQVGVKAGEVTTANAAFK